MKLELRRHGGRLYAAIRESGKLGLEIEIDEERQAPFFNALIRLLSDDGSTATVNGRPVVVEHGEEENIVHAGIEFNPEYRRGWADCYDRFTQMTGAELRDLRNVQTEKQG